MQECSLSEAMGKDTGVAIFMATWSALERVHFGAPQNFLTSQQAVSVGAEFPNHILNLLNPNVCRFGCTESSIASSLIFSTNLF